LGVRDRQYEIIYNKTYHVCPFCGCENFDAPTGPREDLDHYLAESKYPFAATNLRNLVPMGHKCNSKYKLAQDILYNDDGTRRKSYYPYDDIRVQISLETSEPFAGSYKVYPLPLWHIDFEPDAEEVLTWDTVFHIRTRYKRDFLDEYFLSWLKDFGAWCRSAQSVPISSDQELIDAIERYADLLNSAYMRELAFLKAAVFRMLHHHCRQGHERLITLIQGVIIGGMA
jgi:hypothetical protein